MVRHIVLWSFKEGFTAEENARNAQKVKELLESLPKKIPGAVSLEVSISPLPSANRDVALVSLFESEQALQGYLAHPEHLRAGEFVRAVLTDRACADFIE